MAILAGQTTFHQAKRRIVQDGLVLHLDAGVKESYSGDTVWRDLSGRGNNGTLTNGPLFSSDNGGAIVFDGINDYVSGAISGINANNGSSISIWTKTSLNTLQVIASYDSGTSDGFRIQIYNNFLNYTLGFVNDYITVANIADGLWKNITATTYGSTCLFYVNNILINTFNIGNMLGTINQFRIGGLNTSYNYNGSISLIKLYNRVLSASEISQNFNALRNRFGI